MLAFFNSLSPWHLLLLGALALLFYGNRLPEVARSLGKAVNEFKRGLREVGDEIDRDPPPQRDRLEPPADVGVDATASRESEKEPATVSRDDEKHD